MAQQTAIEKLIESVQYWNINIDCKNLFKQICIQALEIEKEQIKLAWENGALPDIIKEYKCSKDYFEQTYKHIKNEDF
jgi:tRNA1(Val) A37 N6-methylase TrmN6